METRGAGVEPVFAGLAFVHTRQGHKNAFSPYIAGVSACSKNLADRVETPVSCESLAKRRAWAAISRFDRENRVSEALERFERPFPRG